MLLVSGSLGSGSIDLVPRRSYGLSMCLPFLFVRF